MAPSRVTVIDAAPASARAPMQVATGWMHPIWRVAPVAGSRANIAMPPLV